MFFNQEFINRLNHNEVNWAALAQQWINKKQEQDPHNQNPDWELSQIDEDLWRRPTNNYGAPRPPSQPHARRPLLSNDAFAPTGLMNAQMPPISNYPSQNYPAVPSMNSKFPPMPSQYQSNAMGMQQPMMINSQLTPSQMMAERPPPWIMQNNANFSRRPIQPGMMHHRPLMQNNVSLMRLRPPLLDQLRQEAPPPPLFAASTSDAPAAPPPWVQAQMNLEASGVNIKAEATQPTIGLDQRKILPGWLREGLERMEKAKREKEENDRKVEEENRTIELTPPRAGKSRFESDSEEDDNHESNDPSERRSKSPEMSPPPSPDSFRSLASDLIKKWMTELLLVECDRLIEIECQKALERAQKKARPTLMVKSSALAAIGALGDDDDDAESPRVDDRSSDSSEESEPVMTADLGSDNSKDLFKTPTMLPRRPAPSSKKESLSNNKTPENKDANKQSTGDGETSIESNEAKQTKSTKEEKKHKKKHKRSRSPKRSRTPKKEKRRRSRSRSHERSRSSRSNRRSRSPYRRRRSRSPRRN